MAVYERAYRGYSGTLTPAWSRFLVIPRFAYQQVFASKLFTGFMGACLLFPLGAGAAIYLMNNMHKLAEYGIPVEVGGTLTLGGWHALAFLRFQGIVLGFLLSLIVAPTLVSADLRNNGLPLYLSRPFTRSEYVLGKISVLVVLLSAITWIPALFLLALQSYLAGTEWLAENWQLAFTVPLGTLLWILVISLVSLAVSALVKIKMLARAILFGLFFLSNLFATIVNGMFRTKWGELANLGSLIDSVWAGMFGTESGSLIPAGAAWIALIAITLTSLLVLARQIRAYEVVR